MNFEWPGRLAPGRGRLARVACARLAACPDAVDDGGDAIPRVLWQIWTQSTTAFGNFAPWVKDLRALHGDRWEHVVLGAEVPSSFSQELFGFSKKKNLV